MDNAERIDDGKCTIMILQWSSLIGPLQPLCISVDWKTKFTDLELERNKQRDEFNTQRAKMKELFMQKEGKNKLFIV